MKKALILGASLLMLGHIACGDDLLEQGMEGGSCYPNGTCNAGYTCASGICVATPDGWGPRDTGVWDFPWWPDSRPWDGGASDAPSADAGPDGPVVDAHVFVPDAPVIPDGVTTTTCGDGVVNQTSEQCDGADLANQSCYDMPGLDFGTLTCNSNCTFNTASCMAYSLKTLAAGTFTMGSHYTEACRDKSDEDQRAVSLTNSFRLSTTPVTQEQFQNLMKYNPSTSSSTCSDCPVDSITWHEAAAYSNALSLAGGLTSCYTCVGSGPFANCTAKTAYLGANIYACPGYRVPTEAEWEYAYRAGSYTAYYNGANSLNTCNSCSTQEFRASQMAWYCNNSSATTMPVGRKLANTWGLYDMAGNVAEWTHDFYQASLGTTAATNPAGPSTGAYKVRRGMSTDRMPHGLRAAERDSAAPGYPAQQFSGFRVAQTVSALPPTCGNGVLNTGEQCDGTYLNNKTCLTEGFSGGTLTCSNTCQLVTTACTGVKLCGNGKIDSGEQCDGTNVGLYTCIGLNYKGGTLACDSTCKFDTSQCTLVSFCGDGKIDGQETCDGSNLNNKTCKDLGYASGTLACSSTCLLNTNGCSGTSTYCGNGKIDSGEQCDGTNVGLYTCVGMGFKSGTLGCTSLCRLDTSACVPVSFCGNGTVEGQEQCDGSNHNNKTCATQGFAGGVLACTNCQLVTSGCTGTVSSCGNGVINSGEQCDGTNFAGLTCQSMGYSAGALACSSTCQRIITGCSGGTASCGNGVIDTGEQCDGTALGGVTCSTLGYTGGSLACSSTCQRVTTACTGTTTTCGNGVIDAGEQCDGTAFGGVTCSTLGYTGGLLACSSTCQRVTTGCTGTSSSVCGDGLITGSEDCDGTYLGGYTCTSLNYSGGVLGCDSTTCAFDTSSCTGTSGGSTPAFANISAGSFSMGSPSTEPCRQVNGNMETAHSVTLTRAFSMMTTEVTRAHFSSAMGYSPSKSTGCTASACPVDTVSWHEAAAYANALSVSSSLTPCYTCTGTAPNVTCAAASAYSGSSIYTCPGYRLPTEAEWEYAYRAGTTTAYYSGANSASSCTSCSATDANAASIAWYCGNATTSWGWLVPQAVGQRTANTWGLYDMAGNVQEWVHDGGAFDLGSSSQTDPVTVSSTSKIMRGARNTGGYADGIRAAYRISAGPGHKTQNIGFRLARTGSGSSSSSCGDGVINTGEACDGSLLGGATCSSLGFTGGALACGSTCQLNTSGCTSGTSIGSWSALYSGTGNALNGVWGTSASNVYAVGNGGTFLHYNGTTWTPVYGGTTNSLRDVWGTGSTNIYLVGAKGTIQHYNGTSFTYISAGQTSAMTCHSIDGTSASNIYVVCDGTLLHYNGTNWVYNTIITIGPNSGSVWDVAADSTSAYVVAGGSASSSGACHLGVSQYTSRGQTQNSSFVTSGMLGCPQIVEVISGTVYSAGNNASHQATYPVVSRQGGYNWYTNPLPSGVTFNAMFGTTSGGAIGVGGTGSARWDGSYWSTVSTGGASGLADVWGSGKTFYAVGSGGIIRRFIAP